MTLTDDVSNSGTAPKELGGSDERPYNLMEALAAVRNNGCNIQEFSCAIAALQGIGQEEVASWLEHHEESYGEIMKEFSQWLLTHSHYERESREQQVAEATGLVMPED
jgi:hypothetical protein